MSSLPLNHRCDCLFCESNRTKEHTKHNPKNRMHAFAYQFEDDVKHLHSMAMLDDKQAYQQMLDKLKTHIASYEEMSGLSHM